MMWFLSTALELLAAAVVLIPLYCLLDRALFHNVRKSILYCIFSFYLAAIYVRTGMPTVTYVRLELNLNLIPIVGFIDDWKNSILNILLFVPLGILLPILWRKYRSKKEAVLFGFGMSLAIELLQILTFRATDVNDLITNTFGAWLGFSLANVLMKKIPAVRNILNEKKAGELYLVCAIVFAVMFFLQPFLSGLLWDMI